MSALAKRLYREAEAATPGPRIERGTLADYAALSEHHYRAGRPATATRVLVMRDPEPALVERWRAGRERAAAAGPGRPIAVLVESLPALSCALRDWALHERYGSWLSPAERARLLNDEVRCLSRVVVHPQWRGLGLAVALVREALRTATTPCTEALAAMGRVSPFFEKAGMTRYARPPHRHDARLAAALERVGWSATDLATADAVIERLAALPPAERSWLEGELRRWYRQAGGRSFDASGDVRDYVLAARDRLLLEPVYYLWMRPPQTPAVEDAMASAGSTAATA